MPRLGSYVSNIDNLLLMVAAGFSLRHLLSPVRSTYGLLSGSQADSSPLFAA